MATITNQQTNTLRPGKSGKRSTAQIKSRKARGEFLGKSEGHSRGRPKGFSNTREIDRREYRGNTIVLLEDRRLMQPDGMSYQYLLVIERVSKSGKSNHYDRRYITGLMRKRGYSSTLEAAKAVFASPGDFGEILGEDWGRFH